METSTDKMCFACGPDNPISLNLKFHSVNPEQVEACFRPLPEHQGYDGIMHGGLVTTLLDEAMAKVITFKGIKAVTAEIKVRFKGQVGIGRELTITGEVKSRKGRLILAGAHLKDNQDKILAKSEGKFMVVEK